MVAKRVPHVALNNVAICCVEMLRSFRACKRWTSNVAMCCVDILRSFGRGLKHIKPFERLTGRLKMLNLMPNISVKQDEPSSGATLTEILGMRIKFNIFSRAPSEPFNWFYSLFFTADPDLTKIRLHSAAVCTSGPCITVYTL